MNSTKMIAGKIIEHPSAWVGNELLQSPYWGIPLPDDWANPSTNPEVRSWYGQLQDELENGHGAVLIKGVDLSKATVEEFKDLFRGFCAQIGTPISQDATGRTLFSVRDEGFADGDSRVRGPNTRKKLSFHTDRCDVIAFLCLHPALSGGENQVVSSMTLYNEMLKRRPDLVEVLCQPYYYQRHNVDLGNSSPYTQQPIFSFFEGTFASNLLRVLIDRAYSSGEVPPMTASQKEALDVLDELANEPDLHFTFSQEAGDILLLNNWVTYHRRTEFEDHESIEKKRHLFRVWLSMPNSRAIDPMFKGNYGATAAGAIRGGMRAVE